MAIPKRLVTTLVVLLLLLVTVNLLHAIYDTFQTGNRLKQLNQNITNLQKENDQLTKVLAERQTPVYVEKEARDKLLMIKPNETLVILPSTVIVNPKKGNNSQDNLSNLQQWFGLFFSVN